MEDLVGGGEPPGLAPRELEQEVAKLHAISANELNTFAKEEADHDDDLVARYQRMEDLVGGGEPSGLAPRELEQEVAELHAISVNEPNTFTKA